MKYTSIIILLGFMLSACIKKDTVTNLPAPAPEVYTTPSILNPNLTYGSVSDIDGNIYATIVIGTQEWMAENLRTTRYSNGDSIPNITNRIEWERLQIGGYTQYNNDTTYGNIYGNFYNWWACTDSRNICPQGWRIPSLQDWKLLTDSLGGDSIAGGKMKSMALWNMPNTDGTNESGFSGLPGGWLMYGDSRIGDFGNWWLTNEIDWNTGVKFYLGYMISSTQTHNSWKPSGLSCRCIKD